MTDRRLFRRQGPLIAAYCAYDPRCPWLIEHDQRTILTQRILAISAGYEDLNDQTLRNDTLLQALTDRCLKCGQNDCDPLASAG